MLRIAPLVIFFAATMVGQDPHYSRQQLKRMMREAHTPDQFRLLSTYFTKQGEKWQGLARQEESEVKRLSFITVGSSKHPSRLETARSQEQYELHQADLAKKFASLYRERGHLQAASEGTPAAASPYSQSEMLLLKRIEELERQLKGMQPPAPAAEAAPPPDDAFITTR